MSGNGSDRLVHIEQSVLRIEEALAAVAATVQRQADATAEGLSTLTSMSVALQEAVKILDERVKVLDSRVSIVDARLTVLERQMADVLERLANHTHGTAA